MYNLFTYPAHSLGRWLEWDLYATSPFSVSALAPGPNETLWMAFGTRVVHYANGHGSNVIDLHEHLSSVNELTAMHWWHEALWLGGGMLLRLQEKRIEYISMLPVDRIVSIIVDGQGRLVVAFSQKGVWRSSDGKQWEPIPLPNGMSHVYTCIGEAGGDIWVVAAREDEARKRRNGTTHYLQIEYHDRNWMDSPMYVLHMTIDGQWLSIATLPYPMQVLSLLIDYVGTMWLGVGNGRGQGVWRYQDEVWTHMRTRSQNSEQQSLASSYSFALAVDHGNRVWACMLANNLLTIYTDTGIYPVELVEDDHDANVLTTWEGFVVMAAFWDRIRARLWLGGGGGELGWIDLNPDADMLTSWVSGRRRAVFSQIPVE